MLNRSGVGVVVEEGCQANRSDVRVVEGVKQKWCGDSCGGRRQTEVVCGGSVWGFLWRRVSSRIGVGVVVEVRVSNRNGVE